MVLRLPKDGGRPCEKRDVYAISASAIFGYEVDQRVHKLERFVGKTAVLGFGFGTGATKFGTSIPKLARALGFEEITTRNLPKPSP
jgi:hypothetical protein